jgi:hypothetical protein
MAYAFSQQVGFHNCFSPALNGWTAADCLWLPDGPAVMLHHFFVLKLNDIISLTAGGSGRRLSWLSDGSAVSCHVVASFFCAGIE